MSEDTDARAVLDAMLAVCVVAGVDPDDERAESGIKVLAAIRAVGAPSTDTGCPLNDWLRQASGVRHVLVTERTAFLPRAVVLNGVSTRHDVTVPLPRAILSAVRQVDTPGIPEMELPCERCGTLRPVRTATPSKIAKAMQAKCWKCTELIARTKKLGGAA